MVLQPKMLRVALNSFFTHHKLNLLLASCIQVTLYGISKLRLFSPSNSFKGLPSRKVNFMCEKEIPLVWTHCLLLLLLLLSRFSCFQLCETP